MVIRHHVLPPINILCDKVSLVIDVVVAKWFEKGLGGGRGVDKRESAAVHRNDHDIMPIFDSPVKGAARKEMALFMSAAARIDPKREASEAPFAAAGRMLGS